MFPRTEMLELVIVDGHAKGIVVRDMVSGAISSHSADAVVLATGGYGNVFYLSTNAKGCNVTAAYRAHKKGALFSNPCFTQIHPTCIPVAGSFQSKLTLMSESLRNDGRCWAPKKKGDTRKPAEIPEDERDYYLERMYPAFGNLAPRDIASRAAKMQCDDGRGVGPGGFGVYLDFRDAVLRYGRAAAGSEGLPEKEVLVRGAEKVKALYGNLFDMYHQITAESGYEQPMRVYPAVHYTMGGLWVDYNLMSNVPGLFVLGEANFSDHGANRLGASALMQGLADGYFILPATIGNYLATVAPDKRPKTDHQEFRAAEEATREKTARLLAIKGKKTVDEFHRELGLLMWDLCGMARTEKSLTRALSRIPTLRAEFWENVNVPGSGESLNVSLEKAGRVADFLEFGELMCLDALERRESCGGHFREEFQYTEKDPEVQNGKVCAGDVRRDDEKFCHVACWEYAGENTKPVRHTEPLLYEVVKPAVRSYR
jgi:succinate dehydrogenase / fumarate reductase flavoprotein subunit